MNDLIVLAITQKRKILFYYDGGIRIVEPHAYGNDKNGRPKLRGYQLSGYSESGKPEGWKLFNVSDIQSLQLLEEYFKQPRNGYNPNGDKAIPNIVSML